MKAIVDRRKPHKWVAGIIQCCSNAGCRWRRTKKSNSRMEPMSRWTYSLGQHDFKQHRYVPSCGSRTP